MYGSLVAATTVTNLEYRDGFIFAVGCAIQLYRNQCARLMFETCSP